MNSSGFIVKLFLSSRKEERQTLTKVSVSKGIQMREKIGEVFILALKKKKRENIIIMEITTNLLLWILTGPSISDPYLPDIYHGYNLELPYPT